MIIEDKIKLLIVGILNGRAHLEQMFGDFNETLIGLDHESKEFLFGHVTGMMEIIRVLTVDDEGIPVEWINDPVGEEE
jgi:hypothetical protein